MIVWKRTRVTCEPRCFVGPAFPSPSASLQQRRSPKWPTEWPRRIPACHGVALLVTAATQEAALARMELTDLWGVARRTAEKLQAIGITTPLQLRQADPRFVRERFSVVLERTVHELRGLPCIALEEVTPNRKSMMASRSFGRPVTTATEMAEAVATYTARVAEKMRRQSLATANLTIFVHTNRFRPNDPQHNASQGVQLPVATADTGKLISAALRGLSAIWRGGFSYKKAGIMFLDLVPATDVQSGLFDEPDTPASRRLMAVVDQLNARYGRDTISYARSGRQRDWKLRSEHLSPRYTTRLGRIAARMNAFLPIAPMLLVGRDAHRPLIEHGTAASGTRQSTSAPSGATAR